MVETGIACRDSEDRVVILEKEAHRLATVDKKGLSQRSDEVCKGIVPKDLRGRAAATAAQLRFTHITICSFLPLKKPPGMEASHLPVGMVVPFSKTTQAMETCWPGSCIRANQSGSITSSIFAEFVETCFVLPMRSCVPANQELLLILDSGGGTFLHLSPELAIMAEKHRCRLFLLPAYGTKARPPNDEGFLENLFFFGGDWIPRSLSAIAPIQALCSLDQEVHRYWAQEWGRFKSEWSSAHGTLNVHQALCACQRISEQALTQEKATASYRACGIETGKAINMDRLLVERKAEIFGSLKAHASEAIFMKKQMCSCKALTKYHLFSALIQQHFSRPQHWPAATSAALIWRPP